MAKGGATVASALARQVAANRSGVGHEEHFAGHRARLTQEICARAPAGGGGRVCLLGIGNANDVDLDAVAARFAEVHLVDIDPEAIERARARVSTQARARLVVQAPVDLSGIFDKLDAWVKKPPSVDTIADAVEEGVGALDDRLPGSFDVVVSCCVLTQLHLALLEVTGDRHPRFEEFRVALNHIHVLTVATQLGPGGVGLLVTDLTSSEHYPPLDHLPPDADVGKLMSDLVHVGNVIGATHPGILSGIIRHDDELKAKYGVRFPVGPWLWHNGPSQTYLVYGLEIKRSADGP
jgi:hypothetical protein